MQLLHLERLDRYDDVWADLLPTLNKHRLVILIVFLATIASAYVAVEFVLWERYESRANLLVKLGRENAEVPSTVQNSALFTSGIREQEVKSAVYILTSRDMAGRVVDRIGVDVFKFEPPPPQTFFQGIKYYAKMTARWAKRQLTNVLILVNLKKDLSDREKAILAVEDSLDVGPEKDTDVIAVRVGLPAPDLAMQVNQTLLDFFFRDYVRLHRSNESLQFFEAQTEDLRKLLEEADRERDRIRSTYGLSAAAEQRSLLLQRRSEASRLADQNESEKQTLRQQQAVMRGRVAAIPESLERSKTTTANPTIQSVKERITVLQLERAKLLTRYVPDHAVIRNIDEEIASLEAVRGGESALQVGSVTSELNPLREAFRRQVEEIDARIAGLDASIRTQRQIAKGIDAELARLDEGENRLEVLNRERKMTETNYLTYSKRREEARIREELDKQQVANVVVMSPPSRPIEPVAPRKMLIMGIAVAVGLLLGVAFALLLEYLGDTVDTPRDLARVDGMPFLGSFELGTPGGSMRRRFLGGS